MGRKLPPNFAPSAAAAAAGRKRKGSTLAPLAACKRSAPAQPAGGWASLPTDIVGLITRRLLGEGDGDGDVVDYICFRAVCSDWRACTPAPRDPGLRDPRLRPRGWVALCDGDAVRPDDACEIVFFHARTGRHLRVPLPELRRHRIVGFTDGLVVLMHERTTAVRVLHPFTRDAADPGSSDWEVLHRGHYVGCALPFQGRLYATLSCSSEIVRLYPPKRKGGPLKVKNIGDTALFLSCDRCLSVSARDLPSLSSNSIYSTLPQYPILVYSLGTGLSERLADSCQIHDGKERIRPSVRPFTIVDHLITYCNPREWSKGLMFHEYHYMPRSFEELIKKIRAQERNCGFHASLFIRV